MRCLPVEEAYVPPGFSDHILSSHSPPSCSPRRPITLFLFEAIKTFVFFIECSISCLSTGCIRLLKSSDGKPAPSSGSQQKEVSTTGDVAEEALITEAVVAKRCKGMGDRVKKT